jgi:hypothetical protein
VQSEIDALRARISSCWTPPPGIDADSKVYIVLRVLFKPDGSISPLSEVKRTSAGSSGMSAFDPKRTFALYDCCCAKEGLNPISPVANPCCNRVLMA